MRQLVDAGWIVEAEGQRIRQPGVFSIRVSSGVDWFELNGDVVPLPGTFAPMTLTV